jgi:hypothetical protein
VCAYIPRRIGKRLSAPRYSLVDSETSFSTTRMLPSDYQDLQAQVLYFCTVCPKSFKRAYDWQRHEEGKHDFNHVEWVCMLHDTTLVNASCLFCPEVVGDISHLTMHNIHVCSAGNVARDGSCREDAGTQRGCHLDSNKTLANHTFNRKDFLAQHVKGMHLKLADHNIRNAFQVPDEWSNEISHERLNPEAVWCGICLESFDCVPERMAHVAAHFQAGCTMSSWVSLSSG